MIDAETAWSLAREDFVPDGALRDICVHDTALSDWHQLVGLIGESDPEARLVVAGEAGPLPAELLDHHFAGDDRHANVHFTVGPVAIVAYLFTPYEIEMSFSPAEIDGPDALAPVLSLIVQMGERLGKRVDMTPENAPDAPIFSFDPRDRSIRFVAREATAWPRATETVTLEGPVEALDGRLVLRIPLSEGGAAFVEGARGISEIVDDELHIFIPDWLAEKLGICAGSVVVVDNRDGKFNITRDQPS